MLDYHLYIYASILSFFTGAFVVITYTIYTRTTPWRKSQFLMWAFRLVCVNTLFSLVALVWNFMALRLFDDTDLDIACRAYLPFPIYFFLCGYGCNIFIACRFTTNPGSIESNLVSKTPIYFVWASSFVMVLPIIILNTSDRYYISDVIDYDSALTDKGSYCMFNHSDMRAQMVNNICFQVPLVLTLGINLWAYVKGLHALQDAPHSVVSREMRRAGVYMSVLLLVWIPNFTVNALAEFNVDVELDLAIEVIVMLTGLQGFLNSVVFLWGYPKYRRWLHNKMVYLCCYCLVDPYDKYYYKCMHSSGVEGEGTEPLLSDDRLTSTTASNSHSLRSPNDSSNESCDISLRADSLRFPGNDASTSVSSAVSSLRSSFSRGYRSSSITNRETYYSAIPENEEDDPPARRMSTVDKIVRFSSSDYLYYNKDDPVCAATDIEDLSTTGATNDVSSAGQEEGGRTRSIDVRIDMSGAEEGGFIDDNESSFLSEEDDAGGHSLHALHALQELREEAALAQENEDEETASKGHEEVKCTPSEVLAATMKRSVSADHALNHHDLHYSGPLSKSPSKEATAYPPHSILKAPEPRPHLIFPFRHSENRLPYPARTAGPVVPGLHRLDSEQEVKLLEKNTNQNSVHRHLHEYEKPFYRLTHRHSTGTGDKNTPPASESGSEVKGHRRRNSADGSVLSELHVKPSSAQAFLFARMY